MAKDKQNIIVFSILGFLLIGLGTTFFFKLPNLSSTKVEVLNTTTEGQEQQEITVEISGSVEKAGVYKLPNNSRVEDLLQSANGFSANADRSWTDKYLNRAAKLVDGQKIYIPNVGEQIQGVSAKEGGGDQSISTTFLTQNNGLTNINTATLSELDKLPGIGPVYGQNIIDHRPYSIISELVSKGAIKQSVYDKIKNLVSIY